MKKYSFLGNKLRKLRRHLKRKQWIYTLDGKQFIDLRSIKIEPVTSDPIFSLSY